MLVHPAFTTLVLGRGPMTPPGEEGDATSLSTPLAPHTSVLTPEASREVEGGNDQQSS